jgi:glycosyltransferase involved in cell wall biosynthesis
LHESRLDVDLLVELGRSLPELRVVLVGPDSLARETRSRLTCEPNIILLGARPYDDVPAYLQHADLIVVPHAVNEFTESLDPIKAYECLASPTPTVATPVAGFRELGGDVALADRHEFSTTVAAVLQGDHPAGQRVKIPSWEDRTIEFERALLDVDQIRG